jgi:CubicO group peptidase (beta-lactamase class C family)
MAQTTTPKKPYEDALVILDQWLEAVKDFDRLPGMTVAVIKDQQVIFSKGYGYADVENKKPMDSSTIFSICSISKLFTSVAIMQLVEAGKLRLDDSISAVLPSYNLPQQFAGSGPITIRSILTHSAGLPRDGNSPYWSPPDFAFPTEKELNAGMLQQKTVHPASAFFQYSNLGISLLGEVVAHISKMPYEQYVEEKILKPLRLSSTHPYMDKKAWGNQLAIGYNGIHRDGTREKMPFFQANGVAAAAGFSSNVGDLAAFAAWQFRLLQQDGHELIRSSTLREMHRVQFVEPDWSVSRGLGFAVRNLNGKPVVGHGGSCPGYLTSLNLYPEDTLAIVVMVNAQAVSTGKYNDGIYNILKKPAGVAPKTAIPQLTDYLGSYDSYTWSGENMVVKWNGGLAMLGVPSSDPSELTMLKHVSGDTFTVMKKNGKPTGMQIVFGRDASGKVVKMTQGSSIQRRIK